MSQKFKVAFFAIVAAQMVLLLAMIGVKEYTLRTGTTVVLQTVPVRAFSFSCLVGKAHHVESLAEMGIVAA